MSALETIRRAIADIRERAGIATDEGAWLAVDNTADAQAEVWSGDAYVALLGTHEDAEHVARWSPAVTLGVADWLEAVAAEAETDDATPTIREFFAFGDTAPEQAALAFARAYLGEESP